MPNMTYSPALKGDPLAGAHAHDAIPQARSDQDGNRFHVVEHHPHNGTLLGFWIYLMSDCLVFACLFAAYAVLGRNYAGGPSGAEIFELPTVALNTAILLFSSITYGFAMLAAAK